MSGRKFRIISDSEDENDDQQTPQREAVPSRRSSDSEDNNNDLPSGSTIILAGGTEVRRRKARLASNSSDEESVHSRRRETSDHSEPEEEAPQPGARQEVAQHSDNESNRSNDGRESRNTNEDGNERMDEQDEPEDNFGDQAEEVPATEERKVVKKRVVKNPQPKLDETRLTGERGLRKLRMKSTAKTPFKGKGYEKEDVRHILHQLQVWGHQMFPKMQLKDILERSERLGTKMAVKVYLRRMRLGEIPEFDAPAQDSDEDDTMRGLEGDDHHEYVDPPAEVEDTRDLFQELVEQHENERTAEQQTPAEDNNDMLEMIKAKRLEAMRKREELKALRDQQRAEEELLETQLALEMDAATSNVV